MSSDPAFVLEVKPAESNESDLVFEKSKDSRNNKFAIARTAKAAKKEHLSLRFRTNHPELKEIVVPVTIKYE